MTIAYVAYGSNQGNRYTNIRKALDCLRHTPGLRLMACSDIYETQAVGPPQRAYLNGVIKLKVSHAPLDLLRMLLRIERQCGRVRKKKWGPRTIDLDILVYGIKRLNQTRLSIPHPEYHKRRFVLLPFCQLAPKLVHPRLKLTNQTLLTQLTPQGQRATIWKSWKRSQFAPSKKRRKTKNPSQF